MRQSLRYTSPALATWVVCGLPALAALVRTPLPRALALGWAFAYGTFGVALLAVMWFRARRPAPDRRAHPSLAAIQSVAALAAGHLSTRITSSDVNLLTAVGLLVIVSASLPHVVRGRLVAAWIAAQTVAMAWLLPPGLGVPEIVTFAIGTAGFQAFASLTTELMLREAAARDDLARVNAQLRHAQLLLAENSRTAERLRIARDLHDTLGHHLTALSLQLDVASRLTDSRSTTHVQQAHAITRLLLGEIRSVVGQIREQRRPDLAGELRAMAAGAEAIDVHLEMPHIVPLENGDQVRSLVRCVQEIITNTSRHAQARNLWIRIEMADGGLALHARDDGRGADAVRRGNGLEGMRERFAEYSGRLEVETRVGEGFVIRGFMPTVQATP